MNNAGSTQEKKASAASAKDGVRVSKLRGNVARAEVPAYLQAKLRIGAIDDAFEKQADRVAEKIVTPPAGDDDDAKKKIEGVGEVIQRKEKSDLAPPADESAAGVRGEGAPLPLSVRAQVEPRLGANFSQVRVHTDAHAQAAAKSLRAKAFTHGSNVVFGAGEFSPETRDGQILLAHELTHVVQQQGAPGVVQRQGDTVLTQAGASTEGLEGNQDFGFSEDEMESRLASTPPQGADTSAPTVELESGTTSTLGEVENKEKAKEAKPEGEAGAKAEGAEGAREERGERTPREGRGRSGVGAEAGGGVPETPGPAAEFEGMVSANVAAYLEGNLTEERMGLFEPRTRELLDAVDLLGDRTITDPDARAMRGLSAGTLQRGGEQTGYEGEPLWLRTLAGVRDVTGQLGGIIGIIGLVATVSGFILSLLIPPVGAFLLTVGRFCDVAALILDGISFVLGGILTGYNLYRLKNETNPDVRRRLLGMVRRDAMGTVMSAVAVATAVAPGAGRLLGRGARRVSSGLRAASRSTTMLGRAARAVRAVGVTGRLGLRAGRRGLRAIGRAAATGFRRLSRSTSLLGRAARGIRVAGVSTRLAMRAGGRAIRTKASQFLGWARGTAPIRWANRLGGQAEEWARRRLRGLAASDTALGRFYNRRLRGFHERNVMLARSINDPIERAYQERLGRELTTEFNTEFNRLRQANPNLTAEQLAQQIDDTLRARFGRERYGHARVGVSDTGTVQFVREDKAFLEQIRRTEFTEIQLIRDRHPNASAEELVNFVNQSPFIKGRWTPEEMAAFTAMNPSVRRADRRLLIDLVDKTGHHTLPAGHAPQISQDPRFIQIVNDDRSYLDFINRAYGNPTRLPAPRTVRVPGARPGGRQATNLIETTQGMVDRGSFTVPNRDFFAPGHNDQFIRELREQGSTGIWRNPRNPSEVYFFNPHQVIGHDWRWENELFRQIFDMNSRMGLNLRRELGYQLAAPAVRATARGAREAATASPAENPSERSQALIDRSIYAHLAQQRRQWQIPSLLPLLESPLMESTPTGAGQREEGANVSPAPNAPLAGVGTPDVRETANDLDMDEMGGFDMSTLASFAYGGATGASTGAFGQQRPEMPPTPVMYSPQSLARIREQRIAIAEAIGVVNDYLAQARQAEADNTEARGAAETLKERNADQSQFAQDERDTVASEQDKLSQASGAQQDMASQGARATSESQRGKNEADSVQSEGDSVTVEPKQEEPRSRSWLERAWDATVGALWDNLIAPAVRAVKRKVREVMKSINDFIMKMINQALGLDEIEAELNNGGQDITARDNSLSETDTGLQKTQDQAAAEQERNQQTMDQADANIADSQSMQEEATILRAQLLDQNAGLQEEESTEQGYIIDFGSQYQPYFDRQEKLRKAGLLAEGETEAPEGSEGESLESSPEMSVAQEESSGESVG